MQFFSFLSRFALGLVLGYATIYSGSLFPAIAAHFVNNSFSIVGLYFSENKEIDKIGTIDNYWGAHFVFFRGHCNDRRDEKKITEL